jgi:hypothetical protein
MYFLQFIGSISKLIYIALTQLKKTESWGKQYLQQLEKTYEGEFEPALIAKVAKYQSIQLHFVANTFSSLFKRKNNKAEIQRNIQYFLMTVLYDELTDDQQMDEKRVFEISYHPAQVNPENFKERVLIAMHLALISQVPDENAYWEIVKQVHLAQKDSAKQFNAHTTLAEIIDITQRKGGHSLVMCRHYLIDPPHKYIDECWYQLGGLIQMTNDLYDTFKDTQEGIHTFANLQQHIENIEMIYASQKILLKKSIEKLPVSNYAKQLFSIKTAIIPAFGDIAINQLKGIPLNSSSLPNFNEIPRKSLIIDMELAFNKYRLIKYAYKNGKLWM